MAFVSQNRIVFVVLDMLNRTGFRVLREQLKAGQVYRTLSLGVELLKRDFNLKF